MADIKWDNESPSNIQWDDGVQWDNEERSYAGRVVKESLPALGNLAVDAASSIPAGFSAVLDGLAHGSMDRAAKTFDSNMEQMRTKLPRFGRNDPNVQDAENTAMQLVEKGMGYVGDVGGDPAPFAVGIDEPQWESPAARTFAEAMTNFAPIPGAEFIHRAPYVGSKWKAARAAETAKASELLERKMAGEAEYQSMENQGAEWQKYSNDLRDLDNQMIQYPKDQQAPQYGGGGKVARPEDAIGREKGKFTNQMAFDEDIRKQSEGYEQWKYQQDEQARQSQALLKGMEDRQIMSALDEQREAHMRRTDPEQIADEVRAKMDRTPKEPFVERLDKTPFDEDLNASPKGWEQAEPGTATNGLGFNKNLKQIQARSLVDTLEVHNIVDGKTLFPKKESPTFRTQLETISKESQAPAYREIAKLLLNDKTFNPRFEIGEPRSGASHASYQPNDYKIVLRPEHLGDEYLVIHEGVHARVHGAMEGALRNAPGFQHLKPATKRLQDLYTSFKDQSNGTQKYGDFAATGRFYGLKNIHEFVAEAFSNPQFQAILARTPVPKGLKSNFFKNYWDIFVDRIGSILGFDRSHHNYLSEVMKASADIMHGSNTEHRKYFGVGNALDQEFGAQYSLKDFENDLKAQGITLPKATMKSMFDKQQQAAPKQLAHPLEPTIKVVKDIPGLTELQQQYVDTRPFEEIVTASESAKDIGFLGKHVVSKMIQGKFTATDHPLMSWVSSNIHQIKNNSLLKANERLHGKDRKNPTPGTYNYVWRQLNSKEREQVNSLAWEFQNKETPATVSEIQKMARETFGQELSRKQLQSYQDRVRINKEVLADINKLLVAAGKEAIPELPNYWSPNVFDGPFLLKFKDPTTGETVKIHSSYTKPNEAKLKKQFPDYDLETTEIGLKSNLDFDQVEWLLRHLSKEMRDPAAKAIAEGLRRQGFMKHGLKRRMVEGGKGSGEGRGALREYEETSERYIRNAYEYISNRELDSLFNQVLDEKRFDGKADLAKAYSLESIDSARGGANKVFEGLSSFLGEVFRGTVGVATVGKVQLPQRALRDVLRQSNKVKTTLLLGFGNLTNIAAQVLQAPTYMPPKLLAMGAKVGNGFFENPAIVMKAMIKAGEKMTDWNSADITKLKEIGALDPTFRYDWSTYASDSDPRYQSNVREHLTGISILSFLEGNAVRRPASLMFLEMLREIGYDKIAKTPDEIYYVAKEMTDHYMVSTKWYEKPHMFSRTGLVGTALGPLQSFATTWAGMLREYGKLAASGALEGNITKSQPLVTFMAMNIATAGLLGLVGIKEWDAIANFLNKAFGYKIMTGTEFIMSKTKSTKLRFGLLSDAVGAHIGATFNAPTLAGSFAPGAQFAADGVNFLWQTAREYGSQLGLNSPPTAVEKRDAIKGVVPRFSVIPNLNWGDVEERFTPPGMPYQDSAGNAGPVTRDDKDKLARRFGSYTLKESTEKTENFLIQRNAEQRSMRLSKAMNKAVDSILMEPDKANARLHKYIQELEDDGFSGNDVKNGLKRELLSKMLESDVRMMKGGNVTSRKAFIAKLLQELR